MSYDVNNFHEKGNAAMKLFFWPLYLRFMYIIYNIIFFKYYIWMPNHPSLSQ